MVIYRILLLAIYYIQSNFFRGLVLEVKLEDFFIKIKRRMMRSYRKNSVFKKDGPMYNKNSGSG